MTVERTIEVLKQLPQGKVIVFDPMPQPFTYKVVSEDHDYYVVETPCGTLIMVTQ
jgi:hypothetical protein